MKILVISDIHANMTALEAVLQSAGKYEAVWCLGDLVGYGPDPNECIERISSLSNLICIKGNHDAALTGEGNIEYFNDEAGRSIRITRELIKPANLHFLEGLPGIVTTEMVTLTHGSPRHPVWEYIIDSHTALANFEYFSTRLAFVGHTHLPVSFILDENEEKVHRKSLRQDVLIPLRLKMILNPGSVGQPRDYDSRASYAIFDTEAMTWENHRITYDIPAVQERILRLGMPEKHALRLSEGW